MSDGVTSSNAAPDRTDVPPGTFAIRVTDRRTSVWKFRATMSHPDGTWDAVETLDPDDEPRLSLEYAKPMPPGENGYWIYSRSYDCELNCE